MIEIKLSQGAKPGHGSAPGPKVNREIAETRGVPEGLTMSPHPLTLSSSPRELIFAYRLKSYRVVNRSASSCVSVILGIRGDCEGNDRYRSNVDFITVDGSEGGTGAAPTEFSDNIGSPLRDALVFVDNALTGAGLRDKLR